MCPNTHSCDNVTNVATFWFCLKSLPEAKMKRFRLILLIKSVSKNPSLDYSALLLTLRKSILIKHIRIIKEK